MNTNLVDSTLEKYKKYVNPSLARLLKLMGCNIVEWKANGAVIYDVHGREFIDCLGGYGVFNIGHCHPKVIEAVKDQLRMPLSSKALLNQPLADLSELLAQITPGNLQYSFVCNSGAEAVEGALKLARLATGKTEIISAENAFHGKTFGALSASGREIYKRPFEPLLPEFKQVPFGDIKALERCITDKTAAIILEPIQGEGGIILPPDDYLLKVRELCHQRGVLLIIDEIQTGLGRTGKLFAVEHYGIVPDIMTLAKALGGGIMPIGAFIATSEVWKSFFTHPLIHTSTFGGNPLACRAAIASIKVIQEENLPGKARDLGEYFIGRLKELQVAYPDVIADVRGKGLLIGIELIKESFSGVIVPEMINRRVLLAFTLNNPKVIRFEPPLVITKEQINVVLNAFKGALEKVRDFARRT